MEKKKEYNVIKVEHNSGLIEYLFEVNMVRLDQNQIHISNNGNDSSGPVYLYNPSMIFQITNYSNEQTK